MTPATAAFLLVACDDRAVGIPVADLDEVMRALPVRPLQGTPPFVLGVVIVRGEAVPVVDLGHVLAGRASGRLPERFVVVRCGARKVALAAAEVVGIRTLATATVSDLGGLLARCPRDVVDDIRDLDGRFLELLSRAACLPDELLAAIRADAPR